MSDLGLLQFSSQIKALKANKKHARMAPGMLFVVLLLLDVLLLTTNFPSFNDDDNKANKDQPY